MSTIYDFYVAQNDQSPNIERELTGDDGDTLDLTGASVDFELYDSDRSQVSLSGSASIGSPESDGIVVYDWDSGDTDTVGSYLGQFVITWATGDEEKFPNDDWIQIRIGKVGGE
jgi:hypothetical protein